LSRYDTKKKILITGAAGFIGFHLAQALQARGDLLIGIDNFNDYYSPSLKQKRADQLAKLDIPILETDIRNALVLEKLVKQYKITHLVHLAAQAGVRYSLINPQAYIDSNVTGFLTILEVLKNHPQIKLVYASSSSVYGNNTKVPFSVTDTTDNQASFYGVTKKANELMAQTYNHLHHLSAIGLRFFTVYGPWGRPDMAYYAFTKAICEGLPIDVFNNGNMERDFTYIDDIVQGTMAAIDSVKKGKHRIYNLGNHHPEPLGKMISLLEKLLKKKAKIHYLPMQPGDVLSTYADISLSQKELGFHPKTSLEKGLAQFVAWYQKGGSKL